MDIKGKTALVTGAAKRVGYEIGRALAEKGANILLHYRSSKAEAENAAAQWRLLGVNCLLFQADLSDAAQIRRMVGEIDAAGHAPDILVNSASLFYATPLESVKQADWDALVGSNLEGPFWLSAEIGKRMRKAGKGKIVNIADWSAFRPYKHFAPYCAAKGGLVTLTKSLAREFAPQVQANAVAPGPVLPPPDMTDEEKDRVARQTLLGRWGSPRDVANAVIFLVENDFVNGTVLFVDGGRSIA